MTRATKVTKLGAVKHPLKLKKIPRTDEGMLVVMSPVFAGGGGHNPHFGTQGLFLLGTSRQRQAARRSTSAIGLTGGGLRWPWGAAWQPSENGETPGKGVGLQIKIPIRFGRPGEWIWRPAGAFERQRGPAAAEQDTLILTRLISLERAREGSWSQGGSCGAVGLKWAQRRADARCYAPRKRMRVGLIGVAPE